MKEILGEFELIKRIDNILKFKETELYNRKENINQNYELAKMDFNVIDNLNDTIEILRVVKEELNECIEKRRNQERR